MRRTLVLGTAALATTASLAVTLTGLVTAPATSPASRISGGLLAPPAAAAAELEPFPGCDELLDWYVEQALREVGPWGFEGVWAWGYGDLVAADALRAAELSTPKTSATDVVGSSDTGTNVQEAGVDEPDRAKTADDLLVHVRGRTLVVTDVSGPRPEELGTLSVPGRLGTPELLVDGDTVLVLGQDDRHRGPVPLAGRFAIDSLTVPALTDQGTRLLTVSIADPSRPVVESDRTFGGSLLSAREHDGTVRLVVRTGYPTLDFVTPNRNRTRAEATEENRQVVRDSTIDDWLPTVAVDGGEPQPLLDCTDVSHPREASGFGTLSVVTFPSTDPGSLAATAVTAGGDLVYASADRLYVATSADGRSTELHAFAIDGPTTSYVASGTVAGTVRDRWSIDAHDGTVRVAVAHAKRWETVDNGVTVLREQGDRLVMVGSVRGLGPDEDIKAVRWFDDLAVLVTFREVDPLYTVDLSDPSRPRSLGELKIPGFSEYLHPVGEDLLLGLGQDASLEGTRRGPQVSLFDIGDLRSPERLATLALGRSGELVAAYDPRTFTWLPDQQVGLAALDSWDRDGSSMVELRLVDGTLVEGRRFPLPRWDAWSGRALPLEDGRVAVVGDDVRVVEVR